MITKIYGAGIAGLLAANAFQTAEIFDGAPAPQIHKALMRFRSPAVGDAVGIPFRKVTVNKGIYYQGAFHQPNIALANMYSLKVVGRLADRSIWKTETVERWIAPDDFQEQLLARFANRITWNRPLDPDDFIMEFPQTHSISTVPLGVLCALFDKQATPVFRCSSVIVRRYKLFNANVYQTVYYPDPEMKMYRASITGDTLIAEFTEQPNEYCSAILAKSFGIPELINTEPYEQVVQRQGKLVPIDDEWRKQFIFQLTQQHRIFSLGRFGTWRQILLDDVLHDIDVIRRLSASNMYDVAKALS